ARASTEWPRGGLSDGRAPDRTERSGGGLSDGCAPDSTERPRRGLSDGRAPGGNVPLRTSRLTGVAGRACLARYDIDSVVLSRTAVRPTRLRSKRRGDPFPPGRRFPEGGRTPAAQRHIPRSVKEQPRRRGSVPWNATDR